MKKFLAFLVTISLIFGIMLGNMAFAAEPAGKIVGSSAKTEVYDTYQQINTVILEYNADLNPDTVSEKDYKITDYFTARFNGVDLKRPYSEAEILAVYTNNEPDVRVDKTAIAGRYVIIELAEIKGLEFVKLDAEGNVVTANEVREIYRTKNAAGIVLGQFDGNVYQAFRDDFSEFEIEQVGEVKTVSGQIIAAGQKAPDLIYGQTITDELMDKYIWGTLKGSDGCDIYYELYLPDNYDPQKQYPLFFNVSGQSTRIVFDESGEPLNQGVVGPINKLTPSWITSGEEMIIVNHQTYRSVPDGHDQVRGSLELLDFIIDEYNADPTRVVAFGNSAGGMHISSVLNNHADRFAGYVMMNSRFTGMTNYFNEPYSNHITGEFTQNGKGWTTQQMWDYLNEEGSRMERSEYIDDAWAAMGSVVEAEMPVWVVHGIRISPRCKISHRYYLHQKHTESMLHWPLPYGEFFFVHQSIVTGRREAQSL